MQEDAPKKGILWKIFNIVSWIVALILLPFPLLLLSIALIFGAPVCFVIFPVLLGYTITMMRDVLNLFKNL